MADETTSTISPAPDGETDKSWRDRVFEYTERLHADWVETRKSYYMMVDGRSMLGIAKFEEDWTPEKENSFWSLDAIVEQIYQYTVEVKNGTRAVGWSDIAADVAIVGTYGELEIVVENARAAFKQSGKFTGVGFGEGGFVGIAWPVIAVIAVVSVAVVMSVIEITKTVRDSIDATRIKDIQKHEQYMMEKGATPAEAKEGTRQTLSGLNKHAEAQALGNENEFTSTVRTIVWGAVIGGALAGIIYLAGPAIRSALTPSRVR